MKKFYVTETCIRNGFEDEYILLVTEDKDEAVKVAKDEQYINERDGNNAIIEIRVYAEDIEDEDCTCFDYDTIKF